MASKQYIPYDRFYKPKDRVRVARFLVSRSRNPQERAYSILDFLQWAKVIPQQPLGIRSTGRFAFPSASRRFLGIITLIGKCFLCLLYRRCKEKKTLLICMASSGCSSAYASASIGDIFLISSSVGLLFVFLFML